MAPTQPAKTWHHLGTRDELAAQVPKAFTVPGARIALFLHEGRFTAIADRCNHKGGPLSQGTCTGEYVKCPWHAWEYSVVTGRGPAGFDEEQVARFDIDERPDGIYVATPAVEPRKLKKHRKPHLLDDHPKTPGEPPRVLGISTTAMDDTNPRYSTSDALLEHALAHAAATGAETQLIRLRELAFSPCEGNYSKAAAACTWPCAITERDPSDGLTPVYEALVHWADVVLVSTPIRWGAASALYFKMAERLNCIQNEITNHGNVLIADKVAAFIITGGQDNIQAVAGSMLGFFGELGFVLPPFPYVAHSRGWSAEDMQNNIRFVRNSEGLRTATAELTDRALEFWHRLATGGPAHPLGEMAGRKGARAAGVDSP
jgi:multimeric flavodoxin WrbA/nitrite reductase/ring-hydroxylating ferredoxin subunit